MSEILNAAGFKIGSIGQDGVVFSVSGEHVGTVNDNGEVWNNDGKVGHYDGSGYVYEGSNHIATINPDGRVVNMNDHYLGRTHDGHFESGGAALALLLG